jgi:hypothetical protein
MVYIPSGVHLSRPFQCRREKRETICPTSKIGLEKIRLNNLSMKKSTWFELIMFV